MSGTDVERLKHEVVEGSLEAAEELMRVAHRANDLELFEWLASEAEKQERRYMLLVDKWDRVSGLSYVFDWRNKPRASGYSELKRNKQRRQIERRKKQQRQAEYDKKWRIKHGVNGLWEDET